MVNFLKNLWDINEERGHEVKRHLKTEITEISDYLDIIALKSPNSYCFEPNLKQFNVALL